MMNELCWTYYAFWIVGAFITYGTHIFNDGFPESMVNGIIWDLKEYPGKKGEAFQTDFHDFKVSNL